MIKVDDIFNFVVGDHGPVLGSQRKRVLCQRKDRVHASVATRHVLALLTFARTYSSGALSHDDDLKRGVRLSSPAVAHDGGSIGRRLHDLLEDCAADGNPRGWTLHLDLLASAAASSQKCLAGREKRTRIEKRAVSFLSAA